MIEARKWSTLLPSEIAGVTVFDGGLIIACKDGSAWMRQEERDELVPILPYEPERVE